MSPAFDDQAATYDRWYATPRGQSFDRIWKKKDQFAPAAK
jgi:hypothetical protein